MYIGEIIHKPIEATIDYSKNIIRVFWDLHDHEYKEYTSKEIFDLSLTEPRIDSDEEVCIKFISSNRKVLLLYTIFLEEFKDILEVIDEAEDIKIPLTVHRVGSIEDLIKKAKKEN